MKSYRKAYLLLICVAGLLACGSPDPYDEVRTLRREYKLELDLTLSDTSKEATYEIKVQNLSGKTDLQEITVLVELMDEDQQVFWTRKKEVDVTGLGSYASKSFQFIDPVEEPGKMAYFQVRLAPDDTNSDFMSYKEFARVSH